MAFKKIAALLFVAAAFAATQAHAGLLGSTVTSQYYAYGSLYNGGGSPSTFIADDTAQGQFDNYYTITVSDNQITYDFLSNTTWSPSATSLNSGGLFITNGNLLTFSGAPVITSVTLDPASTGINFTQSGVTFNSDNVAVDWQNVNFAAGSTVILDVNAVPEPETYALMFAGLGALSWVARRKSRAA